MFSRAAWALLLLLTVIIWGCKKDGSPTSSKPSYTAKMGGIRNWHGSHYYYASGPHFPATINEFYYYPDTSFAVTVIDDSTIQYGGGVIKYDQADTINKIYFFGQAYNFYHYNAGGGVAYYYAKDSIVFCSGDTHATTDQWVRRELYYTY